MTKTEKIRRALLKYPKLKAKDLAKKIGVSVQDVYSARYLAKKQNKANGYAPLETQEWFKWNKEIFDTTPALVATQPDMVNHPPHYTVGGVETIDFIEAKGLNYHLGQVIKYVSRAGKKGDALQDLQKARWYLNREIARVE